MTTAIPVPTTIAVLLNESNCCKTAIRRQWVSKGEKNG